MAKISAILNEQLIMIITKWLQEVKNPEAKCIKITVLKTKGEVKAEYKFHDKSIDTKYVLFTFEDIKKYSGLDLSRILAIEAIEQKKKQREELEKKKGKEITIVCYGKEEKWKSREEAKAFYLDCMRHSEGAERDRYTNIYLQLVDGMTYCKDREE